MILSRLLFFVLGACFFFPFLAFAAPEYKESEIINIVRTDDATVYSVQDVQTKVVYDIIQKDLIFQAQEIQHGDRVFYSVTKENDTTEYLLHEHVRIGTILLWGLAFLILTFFITRGKSIGAFVGLLFSAFVLFGGVIPSLKSGNDPFITCLIAALSISLFSAYASHGIKSSTTVMLLSVWATLLVCALLSFLAISSTHLFGFGEDSASVLVMNGYSFDFQGLLLGGFLLGCVGILDDVVATQIEALSQIRSANIHISSKDLFQKAMSIGNEHIFSMINTLVLVYFSASLPMFLLMFSGDSELMMILNSEMVAEELVRTLVGSFGIVLAVPLATVFGVWAMYKKYI